MYDRDAVIAAVDLRALADELLGQHTGSQRSPTWHCPNPNHAQTGRTPPVSVFNSRTGEQRWRCHGCGEGGTAIDLLIACRGLDVRSAIEELGESAGYVPEAPSWRPSRRCAVVPTAPTGCSDPAGMRSYVDSCAAGLWRPEGRVFRRWLIDERGLPEALLRTNEVGADFGPGRQERPEGLYRSTGVVLPVVVDGEVVYAQLRVPHPHGDRPKYLNPSADFAQNPRIARIRPVEVRHPEVMITEGMFDALAAASAGYRSVAVLSAGYPDQSVAHALSRIQHPLAVAFDADEAGRNGADRLAGLLRGQGRPAAVLDLGQGDLNEALMRSRDWSQQLATMLQQSAAQTVDTHSRSISR